MNTKERVIMLRLLEKTAKNPDYAKRLGIEAWIRDAGQNGCEEERS